jgi:hypothetical protein
MQYLELSYLLRFYNENQLKGQQEVWRWSIWFPDLGEDRPRKGWYTFLGRCTTTMKVTRTKWYHGKLKIRMV